jgi:endoglucanase
VELRAAYVSAVAREAERHGLPWAYWQFDGDFIVYDVTRDQWVGPIHDALVPATR